MRKTLGVNLSHNCSFAFFENNKLKEYYEEDRFNKIKHFSPYHIFQNNSYEYFSLKKFKDITFDEVIFVSEDKGDPLFEKSLIDPMLKQIKYKNFKFYFREHHVFHALCGFYFGNFDKALVLVCDGGGEYLHDLAWYAFEAVESIYYLQDNKVDLLYKHFSNAKTDYWNKYKNIPSEKKYRNKNVDIKVSNLSCCGIKYYDYMERAGFPRHSEGQLMGIAAYKDKNTNLDNKILELANQAQEESLEERIELIEKAMTYSNCKNIILSGGYHLNCSNNFKLVKHFPKLNFFVDPIAHDGGTAVGAAFSAQQYEKNFKN
jgi:carbamoyltransferase|tara:strand:+ start:73 stop:1023 length:951 start_codon:yes stop_codon:yes gene_type:complete